jgi:hypothetical protein
MTDQGRTFVIFGFGGQPRQKLAEVTELVGYALPAHREAPLRGHSGTLAQSSG